LPLLRLAPVNDLTRLSRHLPSDQKINPRQYRTATKQDDEGLNQALTHFRTPPSLLPCLFFLFLIPYFLLFLIVIRFFGRGLFPIVSY
jgi:hypothetical protein